MEPDRIAGPSNRSIFFSLAAGDARLRLPGGLARFGYRLETGQADKRPAVYLDTSGGVLYRTGRRLCWVPDPGVWQWLEEGVVRSEEYAGRAGAPAAWPGWPGGTPDLAGLTWRELLTVEDATRTFRATTPGGGALFLVHHRHWFSPPGETRRKEGPAWLEIWSAQAGGRETGVCAALLRDLFGLTAGIMDPLKDGLKVLDLPKPGDLPAGLAAPGGGGSIPELGCLVLARQCFRIEGNAVGAFLDLDPEFGHDVRVATRRARFALRLCGDCFSPDWSVPLRQELRWLAGLCGTVRDLDVVLETVRKQAEAGEIDGRIPPETARRFAAWRAEAVRVLRTGLQSDRYRDLVASLRLPREAAADGDSGNGPPWVGDTASKYLRAAFQKVCRWRSRPEPELTPARLHRLRIDFKRLRYTGEFFRETFPECLDELIVATIRYQDCLGRHQDARVAMDLLNTMAERLWKEGAGGPEASLWLGECRQMFRYRARAERGQFIELWSEFDAFRERFLAVVKELQ